MFRRRAISPAANRWQSSFIAALNAHGIRVVMLGHVPEPLWPRGQLRMQSEQVLLSVGIAGEMVDYWNVPICRKHSLVKSCVQALRRLVDEHGLPTAVVSYNPLPHHVAAGLYAQEKLGIPWVCIVADMQDPGADWGNFDWGARRAVGRLFLSWGSYRDCPIKPTFHLDGGVDRLNFTESGPASEFPPQKPIVLFAGALSPVAGSSFLVEAFRQVKTREAELWICGRGTNPDVERAVASDRRVKFWGLVRSEELQAIMHQAALFVNPRPSQLAENAHNFPSKVLEYLSYGKPVISTWTDGLSPAYREVLLLPDQETPHALAQTIDATLAWDEPKRKGWASRVRVFLEREKLWSWQASRFREWLADELCVRL